MSVKEVVNVGVIGAGWPGERHADGYRACNESRIIAVADTSPERRAAFAHEYGAPKQYADYHELISDPEIDAVSVALPNFLHAPATIAALEAGKHVLCEKPPALSLAEAKAMEDAAIRAGKVLAYAVQRRFNRSTEGLQMQIAQGELGDIYHARAVWTRVSGVPRGIGNWFTDPARAGGGALIDIGIHVLDLAWFLMGCPTPTTVSGQVFNRFPELTKTDDSAFALVRFADNRSLHVEASWVLMQEQDHMAVHVYGTRGGARLDDTSLDRFHVAEDEHIRQHTSFRSSFASFHAQANNFIQAVLGTEAPRTPAAQGTQLMAMLDGIYRSSQAGHEIAL